MKIDGVREEIIFNNDKDVWEIVNQIIQDTKDRNEELKKNFDTSQTVSTLIPFFACPNVFIKSESQKDISKYQYCMDFGVPPYSGHFGSQPSKWVQKTHIMKSAFNKRENIEITKQKSRMDNAE